MNVLYASVVDVERGDGPGVNERDFLEVLDRRGDLTVTAVIPLRSSTSISLSSVRLVRIPIFDGESVWREILQRVLSTVRLLMVAIRGDHDVAVFRVSAVPVELIAASVILARRTPIALKTVGWGVMKLRHGPRIVRWLHGRITGRLVARATWIDVCTPQLVRAVKEHFSLEEGRVRWIDNAVNTERFFPMEQSSARIGTGIPEDAYVIGYIGGNPLERGALELVRILPSIRREIAATEVLIVGCSKQEHQILSSEARKHGVDEYVHLQERVPVGSVPRYIAAMDVGVSNDRSDKLAEVGNSSQKVRQFVSCGRPVVSGIGGNHFLEEHDLGAIVNYTSTEELRSALLGWLLRSKRDRVTFALRAHRVASDILSIERRMDDRLQFWGFQEDSGTSP